MYLSISHTHLWIVYNVFFCFVFVYCSNKFALSYLCLNSDAQHHRKVSSYLIWRSCLWYSLNVKEWISTLYRSFNSYKEWKSTQQDNTSCRTTCFWVVPQDNTFLSGKTLSKEWREIFDDMFYSSESENVIVTLILGWKFSTLKRVVLHFTPFTPFRVNFHLHTNREYQVSEKLKESIWIMKIL